MFNKSRILITGGTGSLGKKLVQVIASEYKPASLIVFSRDELKQFEMSQRWSTKKYPFIRYMLGDVRDPDRLKSAFEGVDYVIHAAALKQVPAAEYNPTEFIKTNVIGATNVIEAAISNKVKKVVALSTDKACNPINLYGATKLCSDKLFTAANAYGGSGLPRFAVVRYGNVLGSRGSVVPFFKERAKTGVLPITDPGMTRFWITLDQAAHFVLECLGYCKGGEIFVPKIASMKITDLARAIAPECRQEVVGIRPGEKIHETLISREEARNAIEFKQCYIVKPCFEKPGPRAKGSGKACRDDFEYTSANNSAWLSSAELKKLIENITDDYSIERSRWSMEDVPQ